MRSLFTYPTFSAMPTDGLATSLLHLQDEASLPAVLQSIGLSEPRPVLVLVGGASKLSPADFRRVEGLFTQVLAPLAEALQLVVVDGGTDAGIMHLIGKARSQHHFHFPLVGVAPEGLVHLPHHRVLAADGAALEPNHTHCFLVPGDQWGDESSWIARVATAIAADLPSVTVLINGGEVTWQDAANSVVQQRPVIVIRGSGRTADAIAQVLKGGPASDDRVHSLVESGLLRAIDLDTDPAQLEQILRRLLTTVPSPSTPQR
ncbi:hypothetical protein XM38_023330 [Halomicronema hongdechloris C2206]|uniref:LSDAT prokaryote domain-containing protein n=1 Tax=Halomicronema hongdechloris C2206 TaxID=1641165 RepID=A0A1Z3HM50_9CYAN|nr:hypothetical protein [Halomicronema hongdechloris]ASC71381.1 hypothetical protein XM38_023330 [Halomicronema hongdechloris C2206]